MIHLARDTGHGFELLSRYWIGAHREFSRFQGGSDAPALLQKIGMDRAAIETLACEMSVHDMTEFTTLSGILPELYEIFSESW